MRWENKASDPCLITIQISGKCKTDMRRDCMEVVALEFAKDKTIMLEVSKL